MINLFVSYYTATVPERQAEIDYCLKANIENPNISSIILLLDRPDVFVPYNSNKLYAYNRKGSGAPTYKEFIDIINEVQNNDAVNIISNADIIFDESIALASKIKSNECWALSRWEMKEDFSKHTEQIQRFGDSQDVWIFRGNIKTLSKADFPLGKMGCDNRIAYEIHKAGYKISNPSRSVFTWHLHNSGVRGYNPAIRNEHTVVSQPYLNVPVTSL